MRRIDTLEQLRSERKRLTLKRRHLEAEIKKDFQELKAGLEPARLLSETAKRAVSGSEGGHLLGQSVGAVANMIAKTAMRNSGFLPRIVVPFLIKNVAGNLVEKNRSQIIGWIKTAVSKISKKRAEQQPG